MSSKTSAMEMASATPATRDRHVDFLRALSILVVGFGHWLMAIVYFKDGRFEGANALEVVDGLWLVTWILQVMPLFFFVGGFSNSVSWDSVKRRGGAYADFIRSRTARLLRPTAVFVGIWLAASGVIAVAFPQWKETLAVATPLLAKPLWFLAVYVLVVAISPPMQALHRRFSWKVLVVLVAGAVTVDVMRVGLDWGAVGYLNFAFVWLFSHQLGFFYADGTLTNLSRRVHALFAVGGLGILASLTASGIYSPSMVGMTSDKASNNSPPSICLIALTIWLVGLAMLARPDVSRWLASVRNWAAVVSVNATIMTIYLWHLTALMVAVLVLYPIGFPQLEGGTAGWWMLRIPWLACLCVFLAPFVIVLSRFERPKATATTPRGRPVVALVGAACVVSALAGFATTGFAAGAVGNGLMLFVGYHLTTKGARV